MVATTGYLAGIETNATQFSYGVETAWGIAPAVQFQAIRHNSESLRLTKTRQFPSEITGNRDTPLGVTTQQSAGGSIPFALSYKTHDDIFANCLQSDVWAAPAILQSIGTDITLTNTGGVITITSTLAGKFTPFQQGQWIRLFGCVNAINNGYWYISVKDSQVLMHLTGPNSATAVTETAAAANIGIKYSGIRNGTVFRSMFLQNRLSATQYLTYPGTYPTRVTLNGSLGNFFSGTADFAMKSEVKALTDSSTGAILAAPTGRVFDPVAGLVGVLWNETTVGTLVDQVSITMENTGAAGQFVMGSNTAVGMLGGTFKASGSFRMLFTNYAQYDLFTSETSGRAAMILKDPDGNAYVFTWFNALLMGGQITAGGPGQSVEASFDIEAGPAILPANVTFQIDRLAA